MLRGTWRGAQGGAGGSDGLSEGNALTLSAWVKPGAVDGYRTIMGKDNAEIDELGYGLYAANNSTPMGLLATDDAFSSVPGSGSLPVNTWSHLAVTYDGTMARLYLNGAQVGQGLATGDLLDDGGAFHIGGNTAYGDYFKGLIDEVRVYNRAQTAAQVQADMNTPIGAAATSSSAQRLGTGAAANPAAGIEKLTVNDSRTVNGVTVASTLTPHLTTWLAAGRDGEAKVEIELARTPTKSVKADKVALDKLLIWAGRATAKPGDSRVTLQVPEGKLQDGEKVRWRARVADSDTDTGGWTHWQNLTIQQSQSAQPPAKKEPVDGSLPSREPETKQKATRTGVSSASLAETMSPLKGTQAVQAAGKPFDYDRIDRQIDCQLSRNHNIKTWRWVKNSFNVCFTGRIGETLTENDIPTGIAWSARFSIVVHTYVGHSADTANPTAARGEAGIHSRQMKAWIKIDEFYPGGFKDAADRPVKISLSNSGGCFADKNIIADDMGDWIRGADRLITLTSPEAWFPAPDRKGFCGIRPSVSYPETDDPAKQFAWLSPDRVDFRCDSSPRIKNHTGGCVVWSTRPVWHLDGNRAETPDPRTGKMTGVDQTAAHIWKALYDPDDTVPLSPTRKKSPAATTRTNLGAFLKTTDA
ncbi:LamG domain-containing protein [Nonomuraea sp. NPDC049158]|uniref:LamG domain-containing protein n=1 Tax=Nonomuraea sp. NPDC049158 TaxID=3155649 RepID=UPI0033FDA978